MLLRCKETCTLNEKSIPFTKHFPTKWITFQIYKLSDKSSNTIRRFRKILNPTLHKHINKHSLHIQLSPQALHFKSPTSETPNWDRKIISRTRPKKKIAVKVFLLLKCIQFEFPGKYKCPPSHAGEFAFLLTSYLNFRLLVICPIKNLESPEIRQMEGRVFIYFRWLPPGMWLSNGHA